MSDSENSSQTGAATKLIQRMSHGEAGAADALYDLLHDELKRLAVGKFRREREPGHTLQPTALVHEAWLRLVGAGKNFDGREHFLAVAARAMRSVLVDYARKRQAEKRGGDASRVPLDYLLPVYEERGADLVELDGSLRRLAKENERRARVVELRFFGGLTIQETADNLNISTATVQREWQLARLWLLNDLDLA